MLLKKTLHTLNDAAIIAAQSKLDALGNPVSVTQLGPVDAYLLKFPTDYKQAVVFFQVHTGREKVFTTTLAYRTRQRR
jgi:hypothetical protein